MKTILVPTDFSKASANALQYAFAVARRTGSEIIILHVVFPNEGVDNNVYAAFWTDDYYAYRQKALQNWARRQRRGETAKNLAVRTEITVGFPIGSILETAEKHKVDLVIMGTTGATGLGGLILGSVAAGVLGHTQLPVVVVPKKGKFEGKGAAVFATDFYLQSNAQTMHTLRDILGLYQSPLKIVHILDRPDDRPDHAREATLAHKLEGISHEFHYIHDRDVPQAISNYLEAVDAGLLVAVAHKHGLLYRFFIDSLTRRLAKRVDIPLLALHDAKK